MNRIIKFRGKRLTDDKWIYGDLHQYQGEVEITYYDTDGKWIGRWMVDPATVGQLTGLTDNNGKEIFEGDIIEWSDFNGEVKFKDGCFIIPNVTELYRVMINWEVEVIGNIHDNPELLKAE